MANLAARMGLETTGIALPIAAPADSPPPRLRTQALLAAIPRWRARPSEKCAHDTAAGESETRLPPTRVKCGSRRRFRPALAVLALGGERGQVAAIACSRPLPHLWEQGKQYLSIEEIRYDLHRSFPTLQFRQAAAAMYHLIAG